MLTGRRQWRRLTTSRPTAANVDCSTVEAFGEDWMRFDQSADGEGFGQYVADVGLGL